jgi:hypothetical protein
MPAEPLADIQPLLRSTGGTPMILFARRQARVVVKGLSGAPKEQQGSVRLNRTSVGHFKGATVVDFNHGLHLQSHNFTIPYHHLAVDDGEFRALRGAEQRGGYGIVQRSGIADGVKVQREEIGAFAGLQGTDVGASKDSRSAQSGHFEGFPGCHPFMGPNRMRLGE